MDRSTALQLAADEMEERELHYSDIEILDYEPTALERGVLAPPGSVTVFLAHAGAPILDRIRDVVSTRSSDDVELSFELRRMFQGRERMSYYDAYRLLRNTDSFATIRYGAKTLGTNLFPPPGPDLVVLENPYNGGKLQTNTLTLVEHRRPGIERLGRDGRLAALALKHMPPLSDVERVALEQVSENQLEMNLTMRANCCDNWTDFAQVIVAVTFALMCAAAPLYQQISLPAEEIERLGPEATARKLLNIRRELLGHSH